MLLKALWKKQKHLLYNKKLKIAFGTYRAQILYKGNNMREIIASRRNDHVKLAYCLSKSSSFRKKKGLCFLEGARLCADAAMSGNKTRALFFTPKAEIKYKDYIMRIKCPEDKIYVIDQSIADYLADTKNPQGVFSISDIPYTENKLSGVPRSGNFLALENIQNPDNLGAALRTAEAFGISGVVFGGACCDAYSPKALRAGMGAVFRLGVYTRADMPSAVRDFNSMGFSTFAAVPDRSALKVTDIDFRGSSVMVIGNEGNGIMPETVRECKKCVTIPMSGRAESLNASAAAAVLMWEMMRGKEAGGVNDG